MSEWSDDPERLVFGSEVGIADIREFKCLGLESTN